MRLKLLGLSMLALVVPIRAQTFQKLAFTNGKDAIAGDVRFQLAGPDSPSAPQLWEGPLTITHGASACKADASLIKAVYVSEAVSVALIVTISGSYTSAQFFDTATCTQKWPSLRAFTEGVKVRGDRLVFLPACACEVEGRPCSCSAARIYRFRTDRSPVLLQRESLKRTKQALGVGFSGERHVLRPKSRNAKLAP